MNLRVRGFKKKTSGHHNPTLSLIFLVRIYSQYLNKCKINQKLTENEMKKSMDNTFNESKPIGFVLQ